MRLFYFLMFITVIGPLAGCTSAVPRAKYSSGPSTSTAPDAAFHKQSGIAFPEKISWLKRGEFTRYDDEGLDVSVAYTGDSFSTKAIQATLYVYPGPPVSSFGSPDDVRETAMKRYFDAEFKKVTNSVLAKTPGNVVLDTADVTVGKKLKGKKVLIKSSVKAYGMVVPMLTEARLFIYDSKWYVKLRLTYPDNYAKEASQAADFILESVAKVKE